MPKISCSCGQRIDLSPLPAPDGLIAISEKDLDELRERLAGQLGASRSEDEVEDAVWGESGLGPRNPAFRQLYLCPNCGRLYLFEPPGAERPAAVWILEEGDSTVLRDRGRTWTA